MNHMAELSADDGDALPTPESVRLRLVTPAARPAAGGGHRWFAYASIRPLLLLLSGPLVLALVVFDAPVWLRVGPVLGYFGLVPGLACARLFRLADKTMEVVVGVGLSLAFGLLVAQLMLYLNAWSPTFGLGALVATASVFAGLELYRLTWPRTATARDGR
jgi:hypothetical protein